MYFVGTFVGIYDLTYLCQDKTHNNYGKKLANLCHHAHGIQCKDVQPTGVCKMLVVIQKRVAIGHLYLP